MAEFASKGLSGAALGTGIAGLSLGVLNGGLGNLLGGNMCESNQPITRYELEMENKIVEKDSKIALLESNIYTDQKIAEVYEKLNTKIGCVEGAINQQAVYNATLNGAISCMQGQVAQLQALTKVIIPIGNVCPSPMPEFNSWTAPTTTT